MERCPSGLRSWSWKPVTPQGAVGSNPTLSAIQFYTYSIKSSTTRRMIGRLAIATLCLNVSSTAFLYALLIDNLNFWVIGQKVLLLMPMELVKY